MHRFARLTPAADFVLSASILITPASPILAQALSTSDSVSGGHSAAATTNGEGPNGIVPAEHGFNASLVSTTQHDSGIGWSSILTPGLAFRFSPFLSADVNIPVFLSTAVQANTGTAKKPVYQLRNKRDLLGDTSLAAHLQAHPALDYNATFALGLPTGNTAFGLGAGQLTWSFNNHLEKSLGPITPDIELGISNTSILTNRRIARSYTSLGRLAHLQAGASFDLPHHLSASADAYEEMPLTSGGTTFTTVGRKKKVVTTSLPGVEDNGINTSLDLPVARHLTASGIYSHSFRAHEDIAGISLTFLLKAPPLAGEITR